MENEMRGKEAAEKILGLMELGIPAKVSRVEELCKENNVKKSLVMTLITPYITPYITGSNNEPLSWKLNDEGCKFATSGFWSGLAAREKQKEDRNAQERKKDGKYKIIASIYGALTGAVAGGLVTYILSLVTR
jgi:hypothetical protein